MPAVALPPSWLKMATPTTDTHKWRDPCAHVYVCDMCVYIYIFMAMQVYGYARIYV